MTLTPALVRWLQGDEAAPWLAELSARPPADAELLPTLDRLRRHLPSDRAAALVETARLRQRAAAKFPPTARRMFFSRPALEQASPAAVAAHTARRFASMDWVADLGCGLGGDSLALAAAGPNVLAVDSDLLALALAQANARALAPPGRLHRVLGDVTRPAWRAPAAWADPGRRTDAGRIFDPDRLQPPLAALLALHEATPHLGIKLMPGLPHAAIPPGAEAEWISLDGELKEAVLWFGDLAGAPVRRATLLPAGVEITAGGAQAAVRPPGGWLYEPDPAVIRAGAVGDLAVQIGLWQVDPDIAYLSGDDLHPTPFARAWAILEHLPFDLKALNRRLRALGGQVVAVKKRGSPLDPESFRRRLFHQPGGRPLVVVVTRVGGRPWVLIGEERQGVVVER
ncbi:MAG: methyltransferase [Caldilineales bacterium]|nr:methyltransferase [Caldilineales bacterium]